MNHCDKCGLDFDFEVRLHQCAKDFDPMMVAAANAVKGKTWIEECMEKQNK